ncbi:NAD(P)-dependent oxidoreductase [Salibaculum sp.]|uniref:NAD-dependent epimerase/dehydratase family protein n=1 Tax=Salibaculum sp. TaxID=2855480 RepID=UPI002B474E58|nr:NAD(P)-dependent oxidoreductase [Salibaculum sp.]HKL70108.1 NAD(P)-dependent oxidoreductase [Salibaculum sp.]
MKKIVLTGACGALGMQIRETLAGQAEELLSVDIQPSPDTLLPNERFEQVDVSDMAAFGPLVEGADMVVHFAAIVDERPFEELLGPNYISSYNVWEAAWQHGARRIVYASSVHAVGMHETMAGIGLDAPHRPDTFYGLAKCFAEDLGRMYWEKRGMEAVCLRIFSCTSEPQNLRALQTWLSYDDLRQLVLRAVEAPVTGFATVYGISANTRAPVNNDRAAFLGFRPQDNAEDWAGALQAGAPRPAPDDMGFTRLGGPFAAVPLGESGIAGIKAMSAAAGGADTSPGAGAAPAEGSNADKLPRFLSRKMGD